MMINRNCDVITGAEDLEHLYTFKDFPVFMGCVEQDFSKDQRADMSFHISQNSGMIQLNPLLPLDVLYPESHGAGCIGALWDAHHQAFADFIGKFSPASVLEIGGGHGVLATKYQEINLIDWTILEPNPTPISGCRANIIKGFFDENFELNTQVDAVVHSHVFEHIYDPMSFMQQLGDFVEQGKFLIFSLPNMQEMLRRKYTNCLNFEHTVFLSESFVDYIIERFGFKIVSKVYFKDDHSIFYAAVKSGELLDQSVPSGLYQLNKQLYSDYISHHCSLVESINSEISKDQNSEIFLFGAHVFSQYLISFGLETARIKCILDNDPKKQGKRLYGTQLLVSSPEILRGLQNAVVILKAGIYNEEIKRDIKNNINDSVVFYE